MTTNLTQPVFWLSLLTSVLVLWGTNASETAAQNYDALRFAEEVKSVGVVEKLDTQIPFDIPFRDENGNHIHLGDLFNKDIPVILSLNYSSCPMLCKLQLNGLVKALNEIEGWKAGEQFRVISVSIDHNETIQQAKATEAKYLAMYERKDAAQGWSFLVGKQESIRRLADEVGFGFKYLPKEREFAHEAALILCTPEGRVSQYLYGVEYPTQTVKFSLLEASEGNIGTTVEHAILYCFQYDPQSGTYAAAAKNIMKFGGVLILIGLAILLLPFWFTVWFLKRKTTESTSINRSNTQVAGTG